MTSTKLPQYVAITGVACWGVSIILGAGPAEPSTGPGDLRAATYYLLQALGGGLLLVAGLLKLIQWLKSR